MIDRLEHREDCHHSFPRADIALNEPVHLNPTREVSSDLDQYLLLTIRERKGQSAHSEGLCERTRFADLRTGLLLLQGAATHKRPLELKQLLKY